MKKIILASSSPRRLELMHRLGITNCEVVPPKCDEFIDVSTPPEDSVAILSRRKAESVAACYPKDCIIIAADTVVWYDNQVLGKPENAADAKRMLSALAGNWHLVYTGVTAMYGDMLVTEEECTSVLMRKMTEAEIEAYIETGEPMDKAGSYGIQGRGALLCERVDGDFYNVMGLPLFRLGHMLGRLGVDLLTEKL